MKTLILSILTLCLILSCGKSGVTNNEQVKLIQANLIASVDKKWEDGTTLIVTFADGTDEQKNLVAEVAPEWSQYANIKFKFYPSMDKLPRGTKPDIYITFHGQGNTSTVGTDSRSNIGDNRPSMSLSGMGEYIHNHRATILHEFGHAIGLNHEHQHPERTFKFDEATAMQACIAGFKLTEEVCRIHVLKTLSNSDNSTDKFYFSKYDPYSIMHYTLHAGLFGTNEKGIVSRRNDSLSLLDKIEIAKLYPTKRLPWKKSKIEEIIKEHERMTAEIQATKTYKNCSLQEDVVNENRLDSNGRLEKTNITKYKIVSITKGEFQTDHSWEDKESVVYLMKSIPYCNLSPEEIETRRAKVLEYKKSEQFYGNCFINIDENGVQSAPMCDDKDAFVVLKKSNKNIAINLCFRSFKEALKAQKENDYCNLSSFEAAEEDNKQQNKTPSNFCSLGNNLVLKEKKGCSKNSPYFVIKNGKQVTKTCYSSPSDAIIASKNLKECKGY